jgi:hypothetical protein
MKLILYLYSCSEGCGTTDYYYSFEEESKEKAELDIFEICEKQNQKLEEYHSKLDAIQQKRPKSYRDESKNTKWMEEYLTFTIENPFPSTDIIYKNHEIDINLFYNENKFMDLTILTPDEFFERHLP